MVEESDDFKLYPIQATHVGARELYIKANRPPAPEIKVDDLEPKISIGYSTYNDIEKSIQIVVKVEIGIDEKGDSKKEEVITEDTEETIPFELRVEIVGFFEVDESNFPADRIYEWAKRNAVFIMVPYLREHVFALTARAGFSPLLLPLLEVPTLRIEKKENRELAPVITSVPERKSE